VEALLKTVTSTEGTAFPQGSNNSLSERALALLQRDHVRSARLGPICQYVLFGFTRSREKFLRGVLEGNPHRDVQGLACLSLAQYLDDRLNRLNLLPGNPELTDRYHRVFGKEYVEELQGQDHAAVGREAEALFTRAIEQYSDVEIPVIFWGSGGKVGEKAKQDLFKIRDLAVGKEAPDIEGEDQDGKRFKLSDYRGKVVLLDIWNRL
jgi:AhpC/TSA family protein